MSDFCSTFSFCDMDLVVGDVSMFWFFFGLSQAIVTGSIIFYTSLQVKRIRRFNEKIAAESSLIDKSPVNKRISIETDPQSILDDDLMKTSLILPVYVWYLWLIAFITLIQAVTNMSLLLTVDEENSWPASIIFATVWAIQRLCIEGISFFLMQHGAGLDAMKRALIQTSLVCMTTFCVMLMVFRFPSSAISLTIQIIWDVSLLCFNITLYFMTPHVIYARPAIRRYSLFWIVFRLVQMTTTIFLSFDCDFGHCIYKLSAALLFGICRPLVIYYTFAQDSLYWQGLFRNETTKSTASLQKTKKSSVLSQTQTTSTSDSSVGGVHSNEREIMPSPKVLASSAVSIVDEMNKRSGKVKFLNFSHISVIDRDPIGMGGTSKVYKCLHDGRIVAMKMVYCHNLTPVAISNFFKEASLLCGLRHPNVVYVEGVCVVPPSIGLVMEFCHNGSLYDFLARDSALMKLQTAATVRAQNSPRSSGHLTLTAPLLTNTLPVRDRLSFQMRAGMALDCARAVAFLHSQDPPVLHKDIKSLNFLVDHSFVVKIADLELSTNQLVRPDLGQDFLPTTVHWTAPEILSQSATYDEKCDIYSVAIVIWEIMTSQVPFSEYPEFRNKRSLSTLIVDKDLRPTLPADIPDRLIKTIRAAWHQQPEMRLDADQLVHELEDFVPYQVA